MQISNQKNITLTFTNGSAITAPLGVRLIDFLPEALTKFCVPQGKKVVAALVNNEIFSLTRNIITNATLEPVFLDTRAGAAIYRRTLCFVLAAACHKISNKRLIVGHSLGYGYYYTLDSETEEVTSEFIDSLYCAMQEIIKKDIMLETVFLSWADAAKTFEKLGLTETRKQLDCICPPEILVNLLEGFADICVGPLLSHTGELKVFELKKYNEGFLLRFPTAKEPDKLTAFSDTPQLFNIYKMYKQWGKRIGVSTVPDLNNVIKQKKEKAFINITETFQQKQISIIASAISQKPQVKVVLIAGPSSSGKTTTSMKLSLELQAIGYTPKLISLDNYYVGRESNPKDENGNYDYECLEALDIALLNKNLIDLFSGKEIDVPSYDFTGGKRFYDGKKMHLEQHDILVMEGIHGLNDKLTPLIPKQNKFKIYISALTQLNFDYHNRISTTDNRLLRRIVRDYNFRGKTAAQTMSMWDNVTKGERLHIFPFQNNADAMLNTALDYELAVLKVYAEPLLKGVSPLEAEYAEARRLLSFIENFYQIPETAVPKLSIIREFIGGSGFKY